MERIEIVLDMLGTIRRLEKQLISEPDPRVRREIAETLDILNPSFDSEVDRLDRELRGKALLNEKQFAERMEMPADNVVRLLKRGLPHRVEEDGAKLIDFNVAMRWLSKQPRKKLAA